MTATLRSWTGLSDNEAISAFLYTLYQPDNRDGNWFQPIWEYAYTHAWHDDAAMARNGVWEDGGRIVAAALYESCLGEAFFQVHPDYTHLKPAMLAYAEEQLAGTDKQGRRYLRAYVNQWDTPLLDLARARDYVRDADEDRPMSQLVIPDPFPPIRLPQGYRVQSLADDNDLRKVDRVLHRGFNHPGEPPEDGLAGRKKMQSGPHYRLDTTIVTVAPDGQFVSFAGLWYEPVNRFGYVEPVATDPDYRRMGLGTAAVMEGVRRCALEGATVAYVGSTKLFYQSMGFREVARQECWLKYL